MDHAEAFRLIRQAMRVHDIELMARSFGTALGRALAMIREERDRSDALFIIEEVGHELESLAQGLEEHEQIVLQQVDMENLDFEELTRMLGEELRASAPEGVEVSDESIAEAAAVMRRYLMTGSFDDRS